MHQNFGHLAVVENKYTILDTKLHLKIFGHMAIVK